MLLSKSQKGPVLGWKSSRKFENLVWNVCFKCYFCYVCNDHTLSHGTGRFLRSFSRISFSKEKYTSQHNIPILARKGGSTKLMYPINLGPSNDKNCMSGYVSGGRKLGIKSKTVFEYTREANFIKLFVK